MRRSGHVVGRIAVHGDVVRRLRVRRRRSTRCGRCSTPPMGRARRTRCAARRRSRRPTATPASSSTGFEHPGGTGRPWHPPWYAEHLAACGFEPDGEPMPRWRRVDRRRARRCRRAGHARRTPGGWRPGARAAAARGRDRRRPGRRPGSPAARPRPPSSGATATPTCSCPRCSRAGRYDAVWAPTGDGRRTRPPAVRPNWQPRLGDAERCQCLPAASCGCADRNRLP